MNDATRPATDGPPSAADAGAAGMLELRQENTALRERLRASVLAQAKAWVEGAVADGRLPADDTELRTRWTDLLADRPDCGVLLAKLPQGGTRQPPLHDRAQARTPEPGLTARTQARRQLEEVNAYRARQAVSFDQAWQAVRAAKPELFAAEAGA